MAYQVVPKVRIAGVSACVPAGIEENSPFRGCDAEQINKLIASTGIERRRVPEAGICTSDLCYEAAQRLIDSLHWKKTDIDCLIIVTQTADYILPATSCILQHRLGLTEDCYTLDISLGCSGWVYGLSVLSALLSAGHMKKGLLLAGETSRSAISDQSTYPIFGAAGTATAIEFDEDADGFRFHLATDGSGYEAIIIPDGGCRHPFTADSLIVKEEGPGIKRCRLDVTMDGVDVFSFATTKVPETVEKLLTRFNLATDQIDYFVFHQANLFINEKIRKKLKLAADKAPYSLKDFGNTSSATIPLTMVTTMQTALQQQHLRIVACGFGVGLSWASVYFETDGIVCCNLIEI